MSTTQKMSRLTGGIRQAYQTFGMELVHSNTSILGYHSPKCVRSMSSTCPGLAVSGFSSCTLAQPPCCSDIEERKAWLRYDIRPHKQRVMRYWSEDGYYPCGSLFLSLRWCGASFKVTGGGCVKELLARTKLVSKYEANGP